MTELLPSIRNTARAIIVRQQRILLLRKQGGGRGERFALPGGGQEPGETLLDALDRECREEIGTAVEIGELLHVAEFNKLRDTQPPSRRHLVEFLFRCDVPDDYSPRNGDHPDKHQVGVVWAALDELQRLTLYPDYLSMCVAVLDGPQRPFYLGSFEDSATS